MDGWGGPRFSMYISYVLIHIRVVVADLNLSSARFQSLRVEKFIEREENRLKASVKREEVWEKQRRDAEELRKRAVSCGCIGRIYAFKRRSLTSFPPARTRIPRCCRSGRLEFVSGPWSLFLSVLSPHVLFIPVIIRSPVPGRVQLSMPSACQAASQLELRNPLCQEFTCRRRRKILVPRKIQRHDSLNRKVAKEDLK